MSSQSTTSSHPAGPGRRALLKGAAWSIPAVAVAIASPAASASGETQRVIGPFEESSPFVSSQAISMSGLWIPCGDVPTSDWAGHVFDTTIQIRYSGANPEFSFTGWTIVQNGWSMTSTPTTLTLTISKAFTNCGPGAGQLPAIYVTGNPFQQDPGAGTITVDGMAIDRDGPFMVQGLLNSQTDRPIVGP